MFTKFSKQFFARFKFMLVEQQSTGFVVFSECEYNNGRDVTDFSFASKIYLMMCFKTFSQFEWYFNFLSLLEMDM